MDTNINNYSYTELLTILDIDEPTEENITEETNKLITRFKSEDNEELAVFFLQVQDTLLKDLEYNDSESEDEQKDENTQLGNWWQNQALSQSNKVQADKYTTRKNQIDVFDGNEHMIMNRNRLGVNQTVPIPVAQGNMNPNLRNVTTRIVNIDSQFRQNIFPWSNNPAAPSSSTDYTLDLSDPLNDTISIKLYSIQIPYAWYAIDSQYGNNCFDISGQTVSVPSGNYDPSGLVHTISEMPPFNDASLNISWNPVNGKTTFDSSFGQPDASLIFFGDTLDCSGYCGSSTKINNNLGWMLGFRGNEKGEMVYDLSGDSGVLTSEAIADTYGTKYFLLVVDDYNQNHLNKGLVNVSDTNNVLSLPDYYTADLSYNCDISNNVQFKPSAPRRITQAQLYSINEILSRRKDRTTDRSKGPTTTDILAMIPLVKPEKMGDPIIDSKTSLQLNKRNYFGPVDIDRLRVRLLDDKGNTVNLHGNDWSFSIISEHLYQY